MFRDELIRRYQGQESSVSQEIVALKKYSHELRLRNDLDFRAVKAWINEHGGEMGEDWSYFLNLDGSGKYNEAYLWCNDPSVASYAKLSWGFDGS